VILHQLLEKPDPTGVDVNIAIAQGQLCCDLLQNTKEQLTFSDSSSGLKDTIITTQKIELNDYKCTLSDALVKIQQQDQEERKTKFRLLRWRSTALVQSISVAASITIYKLSH